MIKSFREWFYTFRITSLALFCYFSEAFSGIIFGWLSTVFFPTRRSVEQRESIYEEATSHIEGWNDP